MISLRMRVVEAGARAVAFTHGDNWEQQSDAYRNHARSDIGVALDAMLDCLTENADEWVDERYPEAHPDVNVVRRIVASNLVESLREDR